MGTFTRSSVGSVMMEYVIVSGIFLLSVGGLMKIGDGKYVNLLFQGTAISKSYSDFAIENSSDGHLGLIPVLEAEQELKAYGMVGDAWASQSRTAQKIIAMPIP